MTFTDGGGAFICLYVMTTLAYPAPDMEEIHVAVLEYITCTAGSRTQNGELIK